MRHPTARLSIGLSVVGAAIALFVAALLILPAGGALSREPDKTLKLYFGHTGETGVFTFERNGVYDQAVLAKVNYFLRDWRRNVETHMDPHLLDLVWAIYQESGSNDYIHIVSGYRSPATNEMLRRRSSGVAKNSQHRLGKAMDIFLPDVPLAKLRAIAMKMQGGGVGYYPHSGSPFVHVDTGNVRAWPRMTREQLIALFPNGNTLHLPADGKPLPGYAEAVARRQAEGDAALAYLNVKATGVQVADNSATEDAGTKSWLNRVFPGNGDSNDATAASTQNAQTADTQTADAQADDAQADDAQADNGGDGAPDTVVASAVDEGTLARVPQPRPGSTAEATSADASATPMVAAADAEAMQMMVMPALPNGIGDATQLATSVGIRSVSTSPSEQAIATLIAPTQAVAPTTAPIALAYAPNATPSPISDADRAILAAFAAVDRAQAAHKPSAALARGS